MITCHHDAAYSRSLLTTPRRARFDRFHTFYALTRYMPGFIFIACHDTPTTPFAAIFITPPLLRRIDAATR